ncbi:MAG: Tol-Pal system protein TolQ [Chlamydiae bacterium]|nr:Tol-Pal system protein TolQ [Chlamydiota bacterium]
MPLSLDFKTLVQNKNVPNPFLELYKIIRLNTLDILKKNKAYLANKEGSDPGLCLSATDIEQISSQLNTTINTEKKKLSGRLSFLFTTVSLAPLLGLLGTVWGISVTMSEMPNKANTLSNDAVLSGLAMALGTTVIGIVVAIPALIAYNYFKQFIENYSIRMDNFSSEMLSSIEMHYRVVDVKEKHG